MFLHAKDSKSKLELKHLPKKPKIPILYVVYTFQICVEMN